MDPNFWLVFFNLTSGCLWLFQSHISPIRNYLGLQFYIFSVQLACLSLFFTRKFGECLAVYRLNLLFSIFQQSVRKLFLSEQGSVVNRLRVCLLLGSSKKKEAVVGRLWSSWLLRVTGLSEFLFQALFFILQIYLFNLQLMITLNVQIGVNPLINHRPLYAYRHPACHFTFTVGQNGQIVAWSNNEPIFEMCPSVNAEADKLIALTAAKVLAIQKAKTVERLLTIHNDNRLRIWSQEDGICLNVSTPQLFPEPIVALITAPRQSKLIIAVAQQCIYIVDIWLLRIMGKILPKKQTFARFRGGSISDKLELELFDNSNRAYFIDFSSIFTDYFLDFGNYITNFEKVNSEISQVCKKINEGRVIQIFKKHQEQQPISLDDFKQVLNNEASESLPNMILSPDLLRDFPKLEELMKDEIPCFSTLYYVSGSALFLFIGTAQGKLWGIPMSVKSNEDIVIVCETSRQGHSISYIRIFGSNLFVSWEDGWLSVYAVQNLCSYLDMAKINRAIAKKNSTDHEILTIGLQKLLVHEEKLSSFLKYSLPAYERDSGPVRGTFFFRLDRNQIIRYQEGGSKLVHYRGISQETKVYCVILIDEYVCICTDKGVQTYSSIGYERCVSYEDWIWADFDCLEDIEEYFEYRHSDMAENIINSNGMLKYNSRWYFNLLDYYLHGQNILTETFGAPSKTNNQDFPSYYFMQRGEVQKAFHSRSNDNFSLVIKMKLNRIRRDNWNNAAFIVHGNLNAELDSFLLQRGNPKDIISKDFEFYQLLPWEQLPVPFLTKQLKDIGKRVTLKRRRTAQGVGKSFTIYFGQGNFKLSSRILATDSISAIALLQCWVVKDNEVTDHMVQAVEYFARLISSLYPQTVNIVLSKLAVSQCQHISKATINLLISKTHNSKVELHPLFDYFLLHKEKDLILSYNETSWIVYLGLGLLYSPEADIAPSQQKAFVQRIIYCIRDMVNYQQKPHYLLTVMRVFNEGVSQWHGIILELGITELFCDLFKIFFYFDGLSTVPQDDKKFNFCFAQIDQFLRKTIKQGIIKTLIYLAKEFSGEFHGILKAESINQKSHVYYPASVLQILRQFIKSERPQSHLVFYVELLLQCLSPMTPHLRKYVQKNALNTLQFLCTYSNVSFNQPSQRLSVKTQNHIYIYCLRTSTKWRTINIKEQKGSAQNVVELSPQGTYIALLSDKLRIWRLSSGFWSGILGAFSQDSSYEASGKALKWDQNETSITVLNDNPTLNKVIKI